MTLNLLNVELDSSYGAKFVNDISEIIQYSQIRLPKNSAYIDYSTNPYTTYVATGRSDNNFYTTSNGWTYDTQKGFHVNNCTAGFETQIFFNVPGDHSGLTYSDDVYEMVHLNADGWLTYDGKKAAQYSISGLTRTYTPFENFVNNWIVDGRNSNWNDYNNGKPGTISLIMQTMTLPINAALWAGASGSTLHSHHWQGDGSGNQIYDQDKNGNWVLRDATSAVKLVTKDACAKLKSDYGSNLRVYLIKYRKQTKYKHLVTQAETDFDYSYLNNCASGTSAPYMYDITETDPAEAKTKLNEALEAVAKDIKTWAGCTEAKNVS